MNGAAPQLLTIAEVGERLRISRRMTAKLLAQGEFDRVRVGRAVRIPAVDVDDFISRNREISAENASRPGADPGATTSEGIQGADDAHQI